MVLLRGVGLLVVISITLAFNGVCVDSTADMFTSVDDVENALADELSAAQLLRTFIRNERLHLEKLEQLADEWEHHSRAVSSNIEGHVFHPVNYFLLAKYYAVSWRSTVNDYIGLMKSAVDDLLANLLMITDNYPSNGAFEMSASALLRLQDVYSIETDIISNGSIANGNSLPMTADDCFQLGKVAYENSDFYHAVTWLSEAQRVGDKEVNKTTSKAVVLDYLAFAMYKQGNLRHAYNITLEWLQLEPLHERAQTNLHHYEEEIGREDEAIRLERRVVVPDTGLKNIRNLDSFRLTPEFAAYESLCRGENASKLLNWQRKETTDLTCQYRRHLPMFYIRPLKEELISLQPRIYVFHGIISDSEIHKIQQLALPKLHRSGVFAVKDGTNNGTPKGPGFTEYRTSKSAWLNDVEDPLIERVSRKAAAVGNLTLHTVEDLQVLNYGIGGHYEPHYDFSRPEEVSQFSEEQGNRIATIIFYLNDVPHGGHTVFNVLGLSVPASKGSCLLWFNLLSNGDGDYRTRHAGCPVLIGTKWVANKWFHYGGQEFTHPCGLNPQITT